MRPNAVYYYKIYINKQNINVKLLKFLFNFKLNIKYNKNSLKIIKI